MSPYVAIYAHQPAKNSLGLPSQLSTRTTARGPPNTTNHCHDHTISCPPPAMARPNRESSDDELPTLDDILSRRRTLASDQSPAPKSRNNAATPRRGQRLLKPATVDSRLMRQATTATFGSIPCLDEDDAPVRRRAPIVKRTLGRAVRKTTKYAEPEPEPEPNPQPGLEEPNPEPATEQNPASESEFESESGSESESEPEPGSESEPDAEESLWCGSDGEEDYQTADEGGGPEEVPPLKPATSKIKNAPASAPLFQNVVVLPKPRIPEPQAQRSEDTKSLPVLTKPAAKPTTLDRPTSSSSTDHEAVLR